MNREKLLAKKLAQRNREALIFEQRFNEIEQSRAVRSLRYFKKSLKNPLWAVKNPGEAMALLKKVEPTPLPSKMPSERDFLEQVKESSTLPGLDKYSLLHRYPHIKAVVIGDSGPLSTVCHTLNLDTSPWEYLLDVGVEMLVLYKPGAKLNDLEKYAIKQFKKSNSKVVFWVTSKIELKHSAMKDADLIVYPSEELAKLDSKKTRKIIIPHGVNPLVHNPVDWNKKPTTESVTIAKEPTKNSEYNKLTESQFVKIDSAKLNDDTTVERVFYNLLAKGVPVQLEPTAGLKNKLPDYPFNSKSFVKNISESNYRERHSIKWRREVILKHSILNRFEELLNELNIPMNEQEMVSIIHSTHRPDYLRHSLDNMDRQTYKNIELVLILHGEGFNDEEVQKIISSYKFPVQIIKRPKNSLFGENLNLGVEAARGKFITKMDDDDWYGPEHLNDLRAAYIYSDAELVGKWGNFVYLTASDRMLNFATKNEEHFVHQLPGATIFGAKELFEKMKFGRVKRAIDSELHRRLVMRGGQLYSTHRYNFIRVRHDSHTYVREDEQFIADADGKPWNGLDKDGSFV